ncbi:MAG: hypothetical protein ACM31C_26790 [Acidobacteriota bacterium]
MADLEVLRCAKCDAPLVLADADRVTCASCGADNPIPAAYRELVRARHDDRALRDESVRLLQQLDRPPTMATKVLARMFDLPMLAFIVVYGVPLMLFAILRGLRFADWLAVREHKNPDDMPIGYAVGVGAAIILVFAFVPRAIGVYANRRASQRARLLAALRAHPPKTEGGPSTCRLCGAPLAVATDQLVAVCSYCHADNAVVVATSTAHVSTEHVARLGKTMREVALQDRATRRATRKLLVRELARYVWRTGSLATLAVLGMQEDADKHPTTIGAIAIVTLVVLLFVFIFRSGASSKRAPDDRDTRGEANDAPEWLSFVGPIGVWIVLYLLASAGNSFL